MANDAFAAHTRSASFALTLSHPQINRMLYHAEVDRLRAKYPWWETPYQNNFDSAESYAVFCSDSTVRALTRRGLMSVTPLDPPCTMYDVVQLTDAGRLVVALLAEADFHLDPAQRPRVHPHPDDRHRIVVAGGDFEFERNPNDRRDPEDR